MREIKFRSWKKKTGGLYKVLDIDFKNKKILCPEQATLLRNGKFVPAWGYLEDFEVMQFTGLKDKNGKEIYEKDLIGGTWEGGFVDYCDTCKCFQYHIPDFGCMACQGDVHWYELVEEDGKIEVIGNIYENPELLNK